MNRTAERIRTAWDRMQAAFERKPAQAQGQCTMRARVVDGLHCELREGDWTLAVDMAVEAGGTGLHPTPGVLGRGALAGCLAIGYTAWLARAGLSWRSLEVEVQADFDDRGMLGSTDVYPGYLRVRHTLHIDSDAPQEALRRAIEQAQSASPYLHVFADPQPLSGAVVFGPRP